MVVRVPLYVHTPAHGSALAVPVQRHALHEVRRAKLDRARVELVIDDEPVRLAVAVAVVTRRTADGDVRVVQAPALPGFALVARRDGRVDAFLLGSLRRPVPA